MRFARKTILLFGALAVIGLGACADADDEAVLEEDLIEAGAEGPATATPRADQPARIEGEGVNPELTRDGAIMMDTLPLQSRRQQQQQQ